MNDAPINSAAALVLFSGGQDSTTCLAWALERFTHVETVAFDYRQRHRIELDQRLVVLDEVRRHFPQWADRLGEDHFIDMGVLGQISETSLPRNVAFEMEKDGLPNTFVPGRNLLFFTFAAAVAWRRGIRNRVLLSRRGLWLFGSDVGLSFSRSKTYDPVVPRCGRYIRNGFTDAGLGQSDVAGHSD